MPNTKEELYLAAILGEYSGELPLPNTKVECYLYKLASEGVPGGSGGGTVDLSEYAKKEDLVGQKTANGGEIFNDYTNNIAGSNCHAEGSNTKTYGIGSHAEGGGTKASGDYSHAEGRGTIASAPQSHAEGFGTKALGLQSHTEGDSTTASGVSSHTEGSGTKASSNYQHVQGKFNVEDTDGKYAFIIGNGNGDSSRSNAIAIDWDGLIYLNNSDAGIDLSNLTTKEEVAQAVEYAHTHQNKTTLNKITAAKFESWETAVQQIGDIQTVLESIVEVSK